MQFYVFQSTMSFKVIFGKIFQVSFPHLLQLYKWYKHSKTHCSEGLKPSGKREKRVKDDIKVSNVGDMGNEAFKNRIER